jgi:hypothetical protein
LELETRERKHLKAARNYLLVSIFCAFFGAAYEIFSHGVYSYFMLYAFAFPLALGTLPEILRGLRGAEPSPISAQLWGAGVATLTVGSIFRGILDIYGTSSPLSVVYWIVGGLLLLSGALTGR